MTSFHLSYDNSFSVLLAVESLGIRNEVSVSEALCDRIEASVCVCIAEGSSGFVAGNAAPVLRSLALRLTQDDPSVGEIRDLIRALPSFAVEQIESRALRLADQVPARSNVGSDLLSWAKVAPAADLIPFLHLCVIEGGAMVHGQDRPTDRQSAPHYEPVVFGRGRGMKWLPKFEGGRPAGRRIYSALWQRFSGPVRLLMENRYVFNPFWQHHNGIDGYEDWAERFKISARSFAGAFQSGDTAKVLSLVFDRLYVLRNQLVHGGATWNGSVNRAQVRDGAEILTFLMPVFVDIMMDKPLEDWGRPFYPVVG